MRDEVGKFLSTPSARRATSKVEDWEKHMIISIHALREEGDARDLAGDNTNTISIHALREEGDPFVTGRSTVLMLFLSTPSARRATGR